MNHPLLYEINTRCWLRELSEQRGQRTDLGNVPAQFFDDWLRLGFTHLWLMGVWTTGPRSRAVALRDPDVRRNGDEVLPGWQAKDIAGSPYAIASYQVAPALGGEEGLKQFRQKLHDHGLKLVLDFVPNHVGLDHPWLNERPDLFVPGGPQTPGAFRQSTTNGIRWLAHGKDPYFPAWPDTAQLDYRRPETRAAMRDELTAIARRCDGVRCDMAMLLLNDVFTKTWANFPCPAAAPATEFWAEAIAAVKSARPDFIFLAEVYWDLEARLQSLGFDYTYDKRLRDQLVHRPQTTVQTGLREATPEFIRASAHFLENHDEPRVASLLSPDEHRAAALLILGLPGLRLLHEGQLSGARQFTRVQLGRRPNEPSDLHIVELYEQLLTILKQTAVGRGESERLHPAPAWPDNPTAQNFVVVQWQIAPPEFDLVVVNLAPQRSQCRVALAASELANHTWQMNDLLGEEAYQRCGNTLTNDGLYLDLPAHGAQLFHFRPTI